MFKNEEEIRGKLLLPYLTNLGFSLEDISLEKSFKIRLGKTQHIIQGRSDILCRFNDKNIFIIELKRDSLSITKDDIDQGISYARLLDNIAPFTIISNGKQTMIYDTITKKELEGTEIAQQSEFWMNGCTLSSDEDLRIRHLALCKFISFSSNNLKVYCSNQVEDRISPISGKYSDLHAKYIRSIHMPRNLLSIEIDNFLASNKPVFCLVGSSGVGKTSSMCYLALKAVRNSFAMFYNAAILNKSPINYISTDINLFFSEETSTNKLFEKLNNIGSLVKKKVLLFIDSLDESTNGDIVHEISEIAYAISKFENIKLIVSCKLNVWDRFLRINGTNTHLYNEAVKYDYTISPYKESIGFHLKDFDKEEKSILIAAYRSAYNFKGELKESIISKLANGFFLRIFSEVYKNKSVPDNLNDINLIGKYLTLTLKKTKIDNDKALRILASIGKSLIYRDLEWGTYFQEDGVDIVELLDDMDLPLTFTFPEDLFSVNILSKSNISESFSVSFYYSMVRDYIICYHSFRLHKMNSSDFYNAIQSFNRNFIGQSAMKFFIKYASSEQLKLIKKFKEDRILQYINYYENYINNNFLAIKSFLDPHTEGEIGVALSRDIVNEDGYALVPLPNKNPSKIIYSTGFQDLHEQPIEVFNLGAKLVYSSHIDLLNPNTERKAKENIYSQLKIIIDKGKLNEDFADVFLFEKVAGILYYNYKRLGYEFDIDDYIIPRFDCIYPIDLNELSSRLLLFRAKRQYRRTRMNKEEVLRKARKDIKNNKDIAPFNTIGSFPPYEELERVVHLLINKGYSVIRKHHLPTPDIPVAKVRLLKGKDMDQYINLQYSDEVSRIYVQQFFQLLSSGYNKIISSCFPTIKSHFRGYDERPRKHYFYGGKGKERRFWWYGSKYVEGNKETSFTFRNGGSATDCHKIDGVGLLRALMFRHIVKSQSSDSIPVANKINSYEVDSALVLRNWFYRYVKEDFRQLLDSLTLE